ncbi:MAG: hypothetical protein GX299_10140 [Epulopiscium sp.]|jgi:hypothetical protein|nr:hypothetical protein [Candidatus Epulonipiscium sp.]
MNIMNMFKKSVESSITLYENMLRGKLNKLKNYTRKINAKIRKSFQKAMSFIFGKPSSLKDYFKMNEWYVSKRFLAKLLFTLVLAGFIFSKVVFPFLEGRVWPASVVVNSSKFHETTGKAKVYTKDGELLYKGKLNEGLAEGTGEVYEQDSLIYKGELSNNLYNGTGTLYKNGHVRYKGEFKDNLYDGEGVLYYENGNIQFSGTFEQGSYKKGTEYYANGVRKYSGEYIDGMYNGIATLYDSSKENKLLYSGEFRSGMKNGSGKLYEGGKMLYDGTFVNNVYEGQGKLYRNGRIRYNGNFAFGEMNGFGVLYSLATGRVIYEGNFQNGVFQQAGKRYDENTGRVVYEGNFSKGVYDGTGVLYSNSGIQLYTGKFFEGQIDYMQLCNSDLDAIRTAFGKEDETKLFENSFFLVYKQLSVVFEFDFADGESVPQLRNMKFFGEQNINGIANGENLKDLTKTFEKDSFTSYEFVVMEEEAYLSQFTNRNFSLGDVIYCTKYNFDDYYIRMYSSSPEGEIWYFEIGVI